MMDHQTALQIKNKYPEKWNSYFKFTIVKNTWERIVSIYHFRKEKKRLSEHLENKNNIDLNFEEWIYSIVENNLMLNAGISSQLDYFLINEENSMDKVIEFKEIYLVQNILDSFNLKMIHINKSKHNCYSYYYTKKLVNLVYDIFEKEIKYFDFKFESKSKFKIF